MSTNTLRRTLRPATSRIMRKRLVSRRAKLVLAAGLLPLLTAASRGSEDRPLLSNIAMEARLRAIVQATDWRADPNKPSQRAEYYVHLLATQIPIPSQRMQVLQELAKEWLRAGDARGALQALNAMQTMATGAGADEVAWHQLRAIAYLRLGEVENCAAMHGQHSCVFPLRSDGIHQLPEGARGAVQELSWVLDRQPDNALDKWLLNVAYMQLGQYPRLVPQPYLLSAKFFASDTDIGEFIDHASLAGVDVTSRAGGAIVEDFDGDGLLNIATSSSGPLDPMHRFHNKGDGTFEDVSHRAGPEHELGGLNLGSNPS